MKVNRSSPSVIGLELGVANRSGRWRHAAARIWITLLWCQSSPSLQVSTTAAARFQRGPAFGHVGALVIDVDRTTLCLTHASFRQSHVVNRRLVVGVHGRLLLPWYFMPRAAG